MLNQRKYQSLVNHALNSLDIPIRKPNSLHFTFILRRNTILSVGYNNIRKTSPVAKKYGYEYGFIHSEFDAIRRFPLSPEHLSDCYLINIRANKSGQIRNSEPCRICSTFILPFNFKGIYYSVSNNEYEKW